MGTTSRQVVGYVRVSTEGQGDSGAGLAAQQRSIKDEVKRRGWRLTGSFQDIASGKTLARRPQLDRAIQTVRDGPADTIIVSKLDRLSRSVVDFGALMEQARAQGWSLVVIDLGIDLSTPAGEMVATIMATLAQWERRMISDRTRDALATRKADGIRLGRPTGLSPEVETMLATMRAQGMGYHRIAATMAAMGIPTAQGGQWHASSVRGIIRRLGRAS